MPAMLARHAVLLTPTLADLCLPPVYPQQRRATPLESTPIGMLQVFILNNLKLFRITTYEKRGGKGRKRARFAQFWRNVTPFRINTSKSVSKQTTLTLFRMNTYEKTGGRGRESPNRKQSERSASPRDLSLVPTSLPPYFLTSRRASRASCYTVPPMARQRLGQHFLADHWREEIARAIRVSPHSTVPLPKDDQHCWIEIGAGHGEITQHLLATGAPVHAIEIDPAFIAGLRRLAKQFPNLTVVPGDVLETDIAAIASGRRIRVYGNLPYYITSPILHRLFNFADLIDEIHVVIQTEVAHRLAAQPGTRDYGYLSVVTQFYTRPEFVFEIPREAFNPAPEVTSALVTLRLPGERSKLQLGSSMESNKDAQANSSRDAESRFLDFVKLCFSKKRKTLVNNLRSLAKPDGVREALGVLTLRPDARAEQLSVSQLAALHVLLAGTR